MNGAELAKIAGVHISLLTAPSDGFLPIERELPTEAVWKHI